MTKGDNPYVLLHIGLYASFIKLKLFVISTINLFVINIFDLT